MLLKVLRLFGLILFGSSKDTYRHLREKFSGKFSTGIVPIHSLKLGWIGKAISSGNTSSWRLFSSRDGVRCSALFLAFKISYSHSPIFLRICCLFFSLLLFKSTLTFSKNPRVYLGCVKSSCMIFTGFLPSFFSCLPSFLSYLPSFLSCFALFAI